MSEQWECEWRRALHHASDKRNKWNPAASFSQDTRIFDSQKYDSVMTREGFTAFFNSNQTVKSYFPFRAFCAVNFATHKPPPRSYFLSEEGRDTLLRTLCGRRNVDPPRISQAQVVSSTLLRLSRRFSSIFQMHVINFISDVRFQYQVKFKRNINLHARRDAVWISYLLFANHNYLGFKSSFLFDFRKIILHKIHFY